MKTDKISVMLKKNQERKNVHWRIKNNIKMFEVNGYWYDETFFNQMFPNYELCKYLNKGENPDKKYI
jgi:hypothetical protein